jgi:hypothetical protein
MRYFSLLPLLALSLSCGVEASLGLLPGEGVLAIQTDKNVYDWSADGVEGTLLVIATVTNTGSAPVYARLGDAFNAAVEQETIFAAEASDGRVERLAGDTWLTLPGAHLVEGFKTVVLMPGRSYTLHAPIPAPRVTGNARIHITWFEDASAVGTGTPHIDISNTFVLR